MALSQEEQEELELLELEEEESAYQSQKGAQKPAGIGAGTSALRGAEQGVLFGFGDELGGRIAQGVDFAQGIFGESPTEAAARSKAEGIDVGDIPTNRDELYEQARNAGRQEYAEAEAANPGAFMGGNLAGGLALNVVPGLGLAKGASIGKIAASAAAQGAASGAGYSEEEDASGVALDSLVGGALGGALGAGAKVGGDLLVEGAQGLGNKLKPIADQLRLPKSRPDADQIIEAAKRLGIRPTPGMLDDAGFVERLEATLSKSPSIFGQGIRKNQAVVADKLSETAFNLTGEATNLSPYQIGEKFKSGVTSNIGERLDPLSAVFDDVAESTKHIPLSERSLSAVKRNIEDLDLFKLTGGEGKPGKYAEMIPRLKNADQVKMAMTLLNNDISSAQGAERQVLLAIKGKMQNLEKNSILRSAIQQARNPAEGEDIGRNLVGDLKEARTGYRSLMKDIGEVSDQARISSRGGPGAFLDSVDQIPSERIPDKFFNIENNEQLKTLQRQFPEEFELLRTGRIKELQEAATDNSVMGRGEFSTQKFLNALRKLNPEAQQTLFPGKGSVIADIDRVQKTIPRNFNPSGTASEMGWKDTLLKNVTDIPNAAIYKAVSTPKGRIGVMNIEQAIREAPQRFGRYAKTMQDAAQRGAQAVAATNFILQQRDPEYREMLRKMEDEDDQNQ